MCFVNDYDWYPNVVETYDVVLEKPTKCDECWREFPVGATLEHVYQQEHEQCPECDGYPDECECEDGFNKGETFDYDVCGDCRRFLKAVKAAEIEAGCHASESRPSLGGMMEEISNGGRHEARKYWKKAAAMFPEMKPFLAWLWNRVF